MRPACLLLLALAALAALAGAASQRAVVDRTAEGVVNLAAADLLQGLQQLFQGNEFMNQYNALTRSPGTHRNTNRQENKKKANSHRSQLDDRHVATTTHKSSRKTAKSNSSQSNSRNSSDKNQNSNLLLENYLTPNFEVTTKANKVNRVKATSTTTTERNYYNNVYNNVHNSATTERGFNYMNINNRSSNNDVNANRPVTENMHENKSRRENLVVNSGFVTTDNSLNNQNNRQTNNFNNGADHNNLKNDRNVPQSTDSYQRNNRSIINSNNNNRGTVNTDYDSKSPSLTPHFREPSTYTTVNNPPSSHNRGTDSNDRRSNNFGSTNNGFINTDSYPNNFGSNTAITYRERPKNKVTPNFGNTGTDYNIRGETNAFNNRGTSNNFNPNNGGSNNNFNPNDPPQITFPSNDNNPLLNRPGVKPAPVDVGQPPITNKPASDTYNFFNPRPSDPSSISFNEEPDALPKIYIGPDEDDMTEGEKMRYVDMAERMCSRYKALTVRTLVALPLLPEPRPLELNVSSCAPPAPLVIGGRVASIREFPHMALLGWMKIRTAGYSWKCGGSLVSNQYVLTAGHCTYQDKDYDVVSGPPQAVQLGSSQLGSPGALVLRVGAVIRHPKYKMRRSYHDVALLKLRDKVTFSEVIRPACLGVAPPEGDNIIATGWGRTEFGGDHSSELRSVSLPVWNMEDCKDIWGTSLKLPNGVTADSHMCAGDKRGGKDTCQGDSGGPAQVRDGCAWRVVAVTSVGRSCGAPDTPALYAVVPRAFVAAQLFSQQTL